MLRMSINPKDSRKANNDSPALTLSLSQTPLPPSPPQGQYHFPPHQHHHHPPQHPHSHQDHNSRPPPHHPRDLWSFLTRGQSPPFFVHSTISSPGIRLNFVLFTFLHLILVHVRVFNCEKWKGSVKVAAEMHWKC